MSNERLVEVFEALDARLVKLTSSIDELKASVNGNAKTSRDLQSAVVHLDSTAQELQAMVGNHAEATRKQIVQVLKRQDTAEQEIADSQSKIAALEKATLHA